MSMCPAHLTDPGEIRKCEKFGCRDRATCYHTYYYCPKHCPISPREEVPMATERTIEQKLELDQILWNCLRQNLHLDESNAAIHCATVRYSPITFRIAEYLWNHFPSYRVNENLCSVILDSGQYPEDPGR